MIAVQCLLDRMIADLRSGALAPGSWLKQVDLQTRYGVGRPTVRKALEALAHRRMIRHDLHRGYSVHPADDDDAQAALELRAVLEAGFTPAIVRNATADDVQALERLAVEFRDRVGQGGMSDLYAANLAFHARLLTAAGNPLLLSMVEELRARTSPAPVSQWGGMPQLHRSAAEHLDMVGALRGRDADALALLIRRHILGDAA
ncbi:GntR family transcriptional regulator [Falsirhodobacter sp. 1013]|uniref:GntR family transcriptional regulator n=1 Tax=Falsirhodobacter sp. 1013 TaxID=3417566 RepID=UPI003EBFB54F